MSERTPAMSEEGSNFGASLAIIVAVHIALIAGFVFIGRYWKTKPAEQITWLDGGGELATAAEPAGSTLPEPPEPPVQELPPAPVQRDPSELSGQKATPTPTPKPTPTPAPKPVATPKPTATPIAKKQTPAPKPIAKNTTPKPVKPAQQAKLATPKPVNKVTAAATKPEQPHDGTGEGTAAGAAKSGAGNADAAGTRGGPGAAGGSITGTEKQAYFDLVEARFSGGWNPPLTTVATGHNLVATLHILVAADGTVKSATVVKGTGNREVDASVEAAVARFTKVPPPPAALLKDGVMDEKMAVVLKL